MSWPAESDEPAGKARGPIISVEKLGWEGRAVSFDTKSSKTGSQDTKDIGVRRPHLEVMFESIECCSVHKATSCEVTLC
jgi:hypothetical protein